MNNRHCKVKIQETSKKIFDSLPEYYIAHCISADYKLITPNQIAMDEKYSILKRLPSIFEERPFPDCILTEKIFNIVMAPCHNAKLSYDNICQALSILDQLLIENTVRHLVLIKPELQEGISWDIIKNLLHSICYYTECNIYIINSIS